MTTPPAYERSAAYDNGPIAAALAIYDRLIGELAASLKTKK
jgi:hypothetical protein